MGSTTITNSFATGEISPSVWGRTDLAKWHNGASTMRNFFANYRGGASSRAGLAYVGTCKQPGTAAPPRDISFQFSNLQGYTLEFGDHYMRIKSNGAYVTEAAKAVTSVSVAGLFTVASHGFSSGDWVFDLGDAGFSGLTWIVNTVPTGNTFTLTDLFGNVISAATGSVGGSVARIYTVAAPYAAVDLPFLKYTQSADTMTLTCVNTTTNTEYPSYELTRLAITNWTFTADTFAAGIAAPTGANAVASSSTTVSTWYSYVVTAVSAATGEESVASIAAVVQNNDIGLFSGTNTISWNPVPGAGSYNVYKATPSFSVGVPVSSLFGFMGTALGTSLSDTNITADFTIVPPVHKNPFARGPVEYVTPTAGGANYSQQTVSYSVTTSTGAGFSGSPVIVGGALSGFVVFNQGQNYQPGDAISFSDTGGGLATGVVTFSANPADTNVVKFNGISLNFSNSITFPATSGFVYTHLESTLALTLQTLANTLNASSLLSLSVATYTSNATQLIVTYKTPGTAGNAYTLDAATAPCTVSGPHLTGGGTAGSGATATLTIGPESGTYPRTAAYYQQRRAYAASLNNPDTYNMSKPGLYLNMDASIPTTDGDAITGTPWGQQVNGIQFMVPMPGGLVVLTGKGAWQVNGGSAAAITPSDQTATPQAYNGCSDTVVPLTINYDVLYMDYTNSVARDLSYNFFVNIYTGNDLTILSNQLFAGFTISQWVYAEQPYKLVWAVRNDGTLLCLTYLKEQDVYAWSRHDTNGQVVGVCSVREPPVDAVYVIVKRYVRGGWRYYSERMDNRNWPNVEACVCSDSSLQYPKTFPNATLSPAAATGTNNISAVYVIDGGAGYTAPVITALDPDSGGTGATFSATVVGGIITAITPIFQGSDYEAGSVQLVITDATGSGAKAQPTITNNVPFIASASVFSGANVGDVIRIGGGKAVVTSYVGPTQVIGNIIEPITATVPNDPTNTPLPAISGAWSITTPTMTVSGLNHLEGLTVTALADGSVVQNQVVTNGAIALTAPASAITVGLPYTPQLQTMYVDVQGAPGGTVQTKRKNISSVGAQFEDTRGLKIGTNQTDSSTVPNLATVAWTGLKEMKQRSALAGAGPGIPLFTGPAFINVPNEWAMQGQVAFQQDYPLPANILSCVSYVEWGDTA